MGEPVDGVGNSDGISGWNPDLVASVVVEARTEVETSSGVDGKGFTAFGAFVGKDSDAGWSEGSFGEIEGTVNLGVGGKFRVDARRAKKIQGKGGLREKFVP